MSMSSRLTVGSCWGTTGEPPDAVGDDIIQQNLKFVRLRGVSAETSPLTLALLLLRGLLGHEHRVQGAAHIRGRRRAARRDLGGPGLGVLLGRHAERRRGRVAPKVLFADLCKYITVTAPIDGDSTRVEDSQGNPTPLHAGADALVDEARHLAVRDGRLVGAAHVVG